MTSEMLSAEKYLCVVNQRGQDGLSLKRVYRNMRREGLFLKAYAKLYSNDGALTEGIEPEDTVQGMSRQRIRSIIQQLRDGTYQWQPARREYVPKSDGRERPISIPGWSDKMVQEVMRMILEAYYEPRFKDSSHGFRPNRGCHTALVTVKERWKGTKWFIEGDIKGCFDNISHQVVSDLLERDIHDNRFLKLVRSMLKAGYVDDWRYHETYSGTPQGGVISPILSNIVLNELDKYVEEVLIPKYTKGKRKARNPEYTQVASQRRWAKETSNHEEFKKLDKQMRSLPSVDPQDPQYRRLRYVRYADDFLLGFVGPKAEAEAIKAEIGDFLKTIGLDLSEEKTYITNASNERARFLGYELGVAFPNSKRSKNNGHKNRTVNGQIQLYVPRDVVTKWLRKYSKKGKPTHLPTYLHMSEFEIVDAYGAQVRGLANYYLLAANVGSQIGRVRWCCMESLRKTLRNKLRLGKKASYLRYMYKPANNSEWQHMRVTIERDGKAPLVAKCGETPLRVQKPKYIRDDIPPMKIGNTKSELVQRLLADECELCGAKGNVQVHHTRKVSELRRRWHGKKRKPKWVEFMIIRNRKTVIVCKECHTDITWGRYDGTKVG